MTNVHENPDVRDPRFDEAESDVDHGKAWMFREPDAPNPLTIEALEWTEGVTKLGPAEFLSGLDRDGVRWSVLVGSVVLTKKLIEGLIEEWNDASGQFEVVEILGRVQPGEVVSIKFVGDVEGSQHTYPNFKVSRKPSPRPQQSLDDAAESKGGGGSDIPFRPTVL